MGMTPLKLIPKHECGDCTACCTVFSVGEIGKPCGKECDFLSKESPGCSIYKDRPQQCKNFKCHWLVGQVMSGKLAYRPDRLGLIIIVLDDVPFKGILGIYRIPGKSISNKGRALLRKLERTSMYVFEEKLYGKEEYVNKWKSIFIKENDNG